jgi:hypothetical protein
MRSFIVEQLASRIVDEVLREAYRPSDYGPRKHPKSYPIRDVYGNPQDPEDHTPIGGPITFDKDGRRIVNPMMPPSDQYVVPDWVRPGNEEDYINPKTPHGLQQDIDQFPWQYTDGPLRGNDPANLG